jgi:hypothetical protein
LAGRGQAFNDEHNTHPRQKLHGHRHFQSKVLHLRRKHERMLRKLVSYERAVRNRLARALRNGPDDSSGRRGFGNSCRDLGVGAQ